jgi:teichuronic acid biosynthesis glycosyltransferase TuaC
VRILFVSSGNTKQGDVSSFIKVQGDSLKDLGHQVEFYVIKGRGLLGYLKNVRPLGHIICDHDYNVVHAHYSLSGLAAWLACAFCSIKRMRRNSDQTELLKPAIVVSFLGSDINSKSLRRFLIRLVSGIWAAIIVKSAEMRNRLNIKRAILLPNGVNLSVFHQMDRAQCRSELGLMQDKKIILFAADPQREVKNYPLAKAACSQLTNDNCELLTLGNIPHTKIPLYLNSCDVLILTSLWEGSPNIIKEAMACNIPIVSTKVGDVAWLFGDLDGHYLADPDSEDIAAKLSTALSFEGRTKGRDRLIELGLDSETVARKLVEIYRQVVSRQ